MTDTYFEHGKVRVTKNVFYNGKGEHFIVVNISHIRDERKARSLIPLVLGLIMGIVAGVKGDIFPNAEMVLGGLGSLLTTVYFLSKDTYLIYLTVRGVEAEAFRTKNEKVFSAVLRNLRRAVQSQAA
ncbi:MAG: hypothetical protein KGQ41_09855 [Alphaproteobacteria bacterium]|nr:hypothetical protein [Alphaproteobacteria bacterium]